MLNEGDFIKLTIIGETQTPKGESVFIAKHNNRKFLLSKKLFTEKIPELNQSIDCYVDKVNCSGKIFIEPISERMLIGKTLLFKVMNRDNVYDSLGHMKSLFQLNQTDGYHATYISYNTISADELSCRIIEIKKSKLIIEPTDFPTIYKYNQQIQVQIIGVKQIDALGKCYLVKDFENRIHPILVEKFAHYQLKLGNKIDCQILGFDKKHNLKLEPKNPVYEIGEEYKFKTLRVEDARDIAGNQFKILIVQDRFSMEASIVQLPQSYTITPTVKARVYRINNGRLYLNLIS